MAELVEVEQVSRSRFERERAWECDADSIAVTFVADHIAWLLRGSRQNDTTAAVFGFGAHSVE